MENQNSYLGEGAEKGGKMNRFSLGKTVEGTDPHGQVTVCEKHFIADPYFCNDQLCAGEDECEDCRFLILYRIKYQT